MNRTHIRRTSTHAGCLGALAALGLIAGCSNAPGTSPTASTIDPAVAAAIAPHAATQAAAPVHVPLRTGFVRLDRGLHPFALPQYDQGRLDPDQRIHNLSLFFNLSPEQRKDRDALVAAQVDPKSPLYRHWLTPETYAARFGAKKEDLARASAWLRAQGFDVRRVSRLGTRVTFSAKVSELEAAFQTEMHRYLVGGQTHYAMATPPAFPVDLAGIVLGLHNTHDFYKRPASHRINADALAHAMPAYKVNCEAGVLGCPDAGSYDILSPPDWTAAYDVARLYEANNGISATPLDGTGVTIGIVGTAEVALEDINAFRSRFHIPQLTGSDFTVTVVPDTGAATAGRRGDGLEAILDLEWSGAIAKGAKIQDVIIGSTDHNVDDASFYLIEENLAPVMSESFGGCEAGSAPSDADILEENGTAANLMGITYMAAAGDDGADDCGGGPFGSGLYVDMPGSFPGVTSVGGTQFPDPGWTHAGALTAYPSVEAVWNEANDPYSEYGIGAGGGGISAVFPRPGYQKDLDTCKPVGSLPVVGEQGKNFRQVPDVSFSAASATPGILVECTVNAEGTDCGNTGGDPILIPIGGTSASSPSFAGIVAILNQATGERLGNINPLLYALEASPPADDPFHDITVGNNEVACGNAGVVGDAGGPGDAGWPDAGCGPNGLFGYVATTGYDCASGIGSVDGYNLVSAVAGTAANPLPKTTTTLVPTPAAGVTPGEAVTLVATVAPVGASTADLTGTVVFTFESFTATGGLDLSWELGTVTLGGTSATSATATLKTAVPPGLVNPGNQFVDVVAVYGGDTKHLPSSSALVAVDFAPLDFAVVPATATIAPNGMQLFTTTGGTPPVQWGVDYDSTGGRIMVDGGFMGFAFGAAGFEGDGGLLSVGPTPGYVEISAIDTNGIEARALITVGSPDASAPWAVDGGVAQDASNPDATLDSGLGTPDAAMARDATTPPPGVDATVPPQKDAGFVLTKPDTGAIVTTPKDSGVAKEDAETDAGPTPEVSQGGCSCEVRGAPTRDASGAATGLLLALALVARRRRGE